MAERQREKEVARTRLEPSRRRNAGRRRADRGGAPQLQRRTGQARELRRAARAARGAALPARLLANGVARDQLPALLRRQHARRAARRATGSVRGDAQAARDAAPRRDGRRGPHRSSGRPVRSGALLRDAAGAGRARLGHRAGQTDASRSTRPLYVVAEKILSGQERLPRALGRARHDRLQLPERSQRPLRQHRARPAHAPRPTPSSPAHSSRSTTCSTRASG